MYIAGTLDSCMCEQALCLAAEFGHADVAARLSLAGGPALVRAARKDGAAPLYLAAGGGHFTTVERLLNLVSLREGCAAFVMRFSRLFAVYEPQH